MMYNTDPLGYVPAPTPEQVPAPTQDTDLIQDLRAEYNRYGQLIDALTGLRKQNADQQQLNVLFFNPNDPIASSLMVTSSDDIRVMIDVLILQYRSRRSLIYHECSMRNSTPV